jgi:hypothetical protein
MLAARDKHDVDAGGREAGSEIAADAARAEYRYAHRWSFPVNEGARVARSRRGLESRGARARLGLAANNALPARAFF